VRDHVAPRYATIESVQDLLDQRMRRVAHRQITMTLNEIIREHAFTADLTDPQTAKLSELAREVSFKDNEAPGDCAAIEEFLSAARGQCVH
jgi:hypothetical protein